VCVTSVSSDDQCGDPTFSQCYLIWNEIDTFQISNKNLNYANML